MHCLKTAGLLAMVGLVLAAPNRMDGSPMSGHLATPTSIDNNTTIDVNNIEMFITNHGSFGWDLETGNPGTTFPRGAIDKTVIYASGLWIGARVNGELRVTVAEYSQEYTAGSILPDGTPDNEADPSYRVYKINAGDTQADEDYAEWPFADGAPADIQDPDYDPDDSNTWEPLLLGDQTLWAVYNDADPDKHTNSAGNTNPLGIEVRQTVFGFDRQPPFGNAIFMKFEIENKAADVLDSAYVSVWCDPDLGGFTDDLVGCDPLLDLGYCYNGDNEDELYGDSPPAVGYRILQGPIVPSPGDTAFVSGRRMTGYRNLPMTSFQKYINGTDPQTPVESFNYMRGLNIDGSPMIDPVTLQGTKFAVNGDPVSGSGWLDDNMADRRMMLTSGPFTMSPGDVQELVVVLVVARGSDRLTSLSLLRQYAEQIVEECPCGRASILTGFI